MSKKKLLPRGGLLITGLGALLILAALLNAACPPIEEQSTRLPTNLPTLIPTIVPSPTPEPIVPTRTPTDAARVHPTRTRFTKTPTSTPSPSPTSTTRAKPTSEPTIEPPPTTPLPVAGFWQGRPRWGVALAKGSISHYNVEPLRIGWYLNWTVQVAPSRPGGAEYVQMIRLRDGQLRPDVATIVNAAKANPGSLWLIGNEPDVKWQDNQEPAAYARLYHEAYTTVKNADPTAQIAIGGVTQPTPLRMRYLDAVLASYKAQFGSDMPIDVWNVHAFVLREEQGSWGVDIPPGLPDKYGQLYEIDDSDNMDIFRQQIIDFRRWMAERGYQHYPLIVSEYGILMPEDYGFSPDRVVAFLKGSFDFFLTATDPALGYPKDGYRLVQAWCWYSLNDVDHGYPTGNLFDPETGQITAVGQGWVEYVSGH